MSFIPPNTYDGLVEKALSWAVKICNIPKEDEELLNLLNRLISFSLAETIEKNERKSGMVNQRIFPSNFCFHTEPSYHNQSSDYVDIFDGRFITTILPSSKI